jgi:DNA-binding CsgD family transcriptional regulator
VTAVNGFDSDLLVENLAAAPTPEARFAALTQGLAKLGIDTVNYGFFDLQAAALAQADIAFFTTMSDDWMRYYVDRDLSQTDSHVLRVRAGKITPYFWGESSMSRIEAVGERATAFAGMEAGLRSSLCVPLTSPMDPFAPVAGISLGSSMDESELKKVVQEHGTSLLSIAYLFHNASIRQIWQERAGSKPLSVREKDCLQYLADGRRQDAIAQAMGLARVTVEMHLREARKKLGARTLNEAIAKALVFGEIRRG